MMTRKVLMPNYIKTKRVSSLTVAVLIAKLNVVIISIFISIYGDYRSVKIVASKTFDSVVPLYLDVVIILTIINRLGKPSGSKTNINGRKFLHRI